MKNDIRFIILFLLFLLKLFAKFIFPQKALILNYSITFVIDQEWCVCQTLRSRLIKTWFPVSSGAYYRKKWASFLSLSPNDKNINVRIPFFLYVFVGKRGGGITLHQMKYLQGVDDLCLLMTFHSHFLLDHWRTFQGGQHLWVTLASSKGNEKDR